MSHSSHPAAVDMANSEQRRRSTRCCIFSTTCQVNFWLTFLLAVYLCLGALVFLTIEAPYRDGDGDPPETNVTSKEQLLNALWSLKTADRDVWTRSANAAISEYEVTILGDYAATSSGRPWNFPTCIYMVVMAVTTIGYGDVAPVTQTGRFLMIFYSVLGVPLNLLFLSNFGILVASFTSRKFSKLGKAVKKTGKNISSRLKGGDTSMDLMSSSPGNDAWRENWHYRLSETLVHAPQLQGHSNANCTAVDETTTDGDDTAGDNELSNETIRELTRGDTTMNGSLNTTGSVRLVGSESDVYELSEVQDSRSGDEREAQCDPGVLTRDCGDSNDMNGNCKYRANDSVKSEESLSDDGVSRPGDLASVQSESDGGASDGNLSQCQDQNSVKPRIVVELNSADLSERTQDEDDIENLTAEGVHDLDDNAPIIDSDSEAKGKALGTLSVIYVIYTVLGGLFLYLTEYDWTYIDAIYCTFITLSTIGFGDLIPGGGKLQDFAAMSVMSYLLFTYVGLVIFSACFALSLDKIRYVARKIRRRIDICGCCGQDGPGSDSEK